MSRDISHRSATRCCIFLVLMMTAPVIGAETESDSLRIVYLANEGFFLKAGSTSVLVDALFGDGIPGYRAVDESKRRSLELAIAPYDGIDLVLATHAHPDHFAAPSVVRHLDASPTARFLSTDTAAAAVLDLAPRLADRVDGIDLAEGEPRQLAVEGARLTVFDLHHGPGGMRNLGFLLEICGLHVLHIGDTETSAAEMRAAGLDGIEPDLALIPTWYLQPGRWETAIRQVVRPDRIVAMHLPAPDAPTSYFAAGIGSLEGLIATIQERYPEAVIPRTSGQTISLPCQ